MLHWSQIYIEISNHIISSNIDTFDAIYLDRLAEFKPCYHSQFIELANIPNIEGKIINHPTKYQIARD